MFHYFKNRIEKDELDGDESLQGDKTNGYPLWIVNALESVGIDLI